MPIADRSIPASERAGKNLTSPLDPLLASGRTLIMGVVNVTPDSFSDGGRFLDPAVALAHAGDLAQEGADILDIGAESTRPYGGMQPVSFAEEQARLAPVLPRATQIGPPVSIDSMKAKIADWAVRTGAAIVNDVWGLQGDPEMAAVVAAHRVPVIVMHNREKVEPGLDIMADVAAFFSRSLAIAEAAGISCSRIVLDPGVGFGKTPEQSLTVIAQLASLKRFGLPLLVGASRKRFINSVVPSEPDQRLGGSIAAHLLAVQNGAAIIRTHDVAPTLQSMRVAAALRAAGPRHG
jgi:dihydropteroate synthase